MKPIDILVAIMACKKIARRMRRLYKRLKEKKSKAKAMTSSSKVVKPSVSVKGGKMKPIDIMVAILACRKIARRIRRIIKKRKEKKSKEGSTSKDTVKSVSVGSKAKEDKSKPKSKFTAVKGGAKMKPLQILKAILGLKKIAKRIRRLVKKRKEAKAKAKAEKPKK